MKTFDEWKTIYHDTLAKLFDDPVFSEHLNTAEFELVYEQIDDRPSRGLLTSIMLQIDEDPLHYMRHIPNYYLYHGLYSEKRFTIPENIDSIGDEAFAMNEPLEEVDIKSHRLHTIGSRVFEGCLELKSVCLPGSVKVMGDEVFGTCPKLTEIVFQESMALFHQRFSGISAWRRHSSVKKVVCSDGIIQF